MGLDYKKIQRRARKYFRIFNKLEERFGQIGENEDIVYARYRALDGYDRQIKLLPEDSPLRIKIERGNEEALSSSPSRRINEAVKRTIRRYLEAGGL